MTTIHRHYCRACVQVDLQPPATRVSRDQVPAPDSRATGAPNAPARLVPRPRDTQALTSCSLSADCEFSISDILPHSAGGFCRRSAGGFQYTPFFLSCRVFFLLSSVFGIFSCGVRGVGQRPRFWLSTSALSFIYISNVCLVLSRDRARPRPRAPAPCTRPKC